MVELGADEDGDPITSCVVVSASATSTQCQRVPTGNANLALQALHDALEAHGRRVPNFSATSGNAVEKSTWCEAFLAHQVNTNLLPDSLRKNFNRAATWLEENGYIETQGEYVRVRNADEDTEGHVPDMSYEFATQ